MKNISIGDHINLLYIKFNFVANYFLNFLRNASFRSCRLVLSSLITLPLIKLLSQRIVGKDFEYASPTSGKSLSYACFGVNFLDLTDCFVCKFVININRASDLNQCPIINYLAETETTEPPVLLAKRLLAIFAPRRVG